MSVTTSKATLFRICSFLTLFLGFLTAFVGELVMLSLHLKAARTTLYIACGAIIAGGIACLGARVPPTRPFSASATDSSAATVAPVCYYVMRGWGWCFCCLRLWRTWLGVFLLVDGCWCS